MLSDSGRYRSQDRGNKSLIKLNPLKFDMSVRDIAVNSGKGQFIGTTSDYPLPTTDAKTYKVKRYQTSWEMNKSDNLTFIGKIFFDSKKPERVSPAPNLYSHRESYLKYCTPNAVSQKMGSEKRLTKID